MRYETPELRYDKVSGAWCDFGQSAYACPEPIDQHFIVGRGRTIIIVVDTKPIAGAVEAKRPAFWDLRLAMHFLLKRIPKGTSVWWWVEIV